jgi:hypothetical protein
MWAEKTSKAAESSAARRAVQPPSTAFDSLTPDYVAPRLPVGDWSSSNNRAFRTSA